MTNTLLFVLYLLSSLFGHNVDGIQTILNNEDLGLRKQFRLINKSSIKSINTEFGDTIDCIDIYKQPAFEHHLLEDHKLQMKPNFQNMIEKLNENNSRMTIVFGLDKDECPTGTVPILRMTKENLIREKSLLNDHILVQDIPGVHLAEVSMLPQFGPYYGVRGVNSIYNPRVHTKSQISMSHLWVQNGPIESTNKISTGWHVAPQLYGDYSTHFYTSWTTDNFKKTGCYNIRCAGFVQTNRKIYLGARLSQPSVYGGPTYDFALSISQDRVTKNWWLIVEGEYIGYFPAKLFTNMNSANEVGWGGRTRTALGTLSPQMGSGHVPDGNISHSGYFSEMFIADAKGKPYAPKLSEAHSFTDKPNCFGVKYFGFVGPKYGNLLQFGGPGGTCGN